MLMNVDEGSIQELVYNHIKENRITIEQGLDLVYNFTIAATLEMQLWDIETAIANKDSLEDVKNILEEELDNAEKELSDLAVECKVKL